MGNKPAVVTPELTWLELGKSAWKQLSLLPVDPTSPVIVAATLLAAFVLFYVFQSFVSRPPQKGEAGATGRYQPLDNITVNVSLDDLEKVKTFIRALRNSVEVLVGPGADPVLVKLYLNTENEITYRLSDNDIAVHEKYDINKITSARVIQDTKDRVPKVLVAFDGQLIALMGVDKDDPRPQLVDLAEGFGSLVLAAGDEKTPLSALLTEVSAQSILEAKGEGGSPLKSTLETLSFVGNLVVLQPTEAVVGLFTTHDTTKQETPHP